jgi:translation initiation factor IF-3
VASGLEGRKQAIDRQFRVNEQIRVSPLRVIDQEGRQVGVLSREEALALARRMGLDLVEVAPGERPPVCRLMDYGKFKYEQKKKQRKEHQVHTKEIRLRANTGEHDLETKVRHAHEILEGKDKVLISMLLLARGSQLLNVEESRARMERIVQRLSDVGKLERPIALEGNKLTALLAPL